jgi:hypothetical protein
VSRHDVTVWLGRPAALLGALLAVSGGGAGPAGCATRGTAGDTRPDDNIALPRNWDDIYLDFAVERKQPTLAVLPFPASANGAVPADLQVGDILTTALFKTGRFTLVERDRIRDVLAEQNFGRSGQVDPTTAAAIGKLTGATAVIFGVISSATRQKIDKFAYDLVRTEVRIDARAVDTTTGRLIFGESGTGVSDFKIVTRADGTVISGTEDPGAEFTNATANATRGLSEQIGRRFPVVGFVVSRDGNQLLTDLGNDKDLAVEDRLLVLRPIERLFHPITQQRAGWKKSLLALARVQAVEVTSSTAQLLRTAPASQPVQPGDVVVLRRD